MSKLLYCNIGWMNYYRGLDAGDNISGGGKYVNENEFGHEIFNFKPFQGEVFGYVQPPGSGGYNQRKININRLGASSEVERIESIDIVWTAPSHLRGCTVVIGWFRNATVFRSWQAPPQDSLRYFKNEDIGYFCRALEKDSVLLPLDRRVLEVPRGKGWLGQANIWYAGKEENQSFNKEILNLLKTGITPKATVRKQNTASPRYQGDPQKRKKVEDAAVDHVRKYYEAEGYIVESVESENLGWDLYARFKDLELKIEVKGLSGSQILVELTPNEFQKMEDYKEVYRVAVVTNALSDPTLSLLSYNSENDSWEDSSGNKVKVDKIVAARLTVPI